MLPNIPAPSTLSPLKRRKSDLSEKFKSPPGKTSEKESDKKNEAVKLNSMGYFATSPHYMKMYELLRVAYNNYKVSFSCFSYKISIYNLNYCFINNISKVSLIVYLLSCMNCRIVKY